MCSVERGRSEPTGGVERRESGVARPRMCQPMSSVGSSERAASASCFILLHSCTFCLLFLVNRASLPALNATAMCACGTGQAVRCGGRVRGGRRPRWDGQACCCVLARGWRPRRLRAGGSFPSLSQWRYPIQHFYRGGDPAERASDKRDLRRLVPRPKPAPWHSSDRSSAPPPRVLWHQ